MIIILKQGTQKEKINDFIKDLEGLGVKTHLSAGEHTTIIGLVGDTTVVDIDSIKAIPMVEDVKRVQEPYKKANRKFHADDTIINVSGKKIGGGNFAVMAGPCSVESQEQMEEIAYKISKSGSGFIRGGAFKPRTSPYSFQGLEDKGIEILQKIKKATGMPIVTEIMDTADVSLFENVDIIQVGARNMQNFKLLKELGKCKQPILLKRGLANTIEELLMSAEYIMAGGNENIILCERGIRTFETITRNTLDISAIPVIKKLSHLPVIVDPSHAGGIAWLVEPLAKAAIGAGADGLMIEVHNNPQKALSDGAQSITPDEFDGLMKKLAKYLELENKILAL